MKIKTKIHIAPLLEEYQQLEKRCKQMHKAIVMLQGICEHENKEYISTGSHKRYYKCPSCGADIEE